MNTDSNKINANVDEVLSGALQEGLNSGISGAAAMGIQIVSLMWLHTSMTYQYKFGSQQGLINTIRHLHSEGGIRRLYFGIAPALIQGPLGRFGDTASSTYVLTVFDESGQGHIPMYLQTSCASAVAALWRIVLMPLNTLQTMNQVSGSQGYTTLHNKFLKHGVSIFFHGASGEATTCFGGHFFWFGTYNTLNQYLPETNDTKLRIARNGFLGICSAVVTDCFTNWLRVIKTYRQAHSEPISYAVSVKEISHQDGGFRHLFFRGLKTRLIFSTTQGFVFSIFWNIIKDQHLFYDSTVQHQYIK